ncbi:MAG: hypothetical protein H6565_04380 [Lewinellaceae bacterium]|nr:hypothetical protein [Lewinellaceae bacterium]
MHPALISAIFAKILKTGYPGNLFLKNDSSGFWKLCENVCLLPAGLQAHLCTIRSDWDVDTVRYTAFKTQPEKPAYPVAPIKPPGRKS